RMSDPAELWRTQQNATFPASCLPLAVDGLKLVKLDAAAGAILTASLRSDGLVRPIPDAKRNDLRTHRELIARVLVEVPLAPDAKAYFERLAFLSTHVLMG
ncbi:MAG: hypothetical protein JO332_15805, partial [Planctomycetaceae bacterium]|nr:hypothetical protein [Planctomycetaceae bacterium]